MFLWVFSSGQQLDFLRKNFNLEPKKVTPGIMSRMRWPGAKLKFFTPGGEKLKRLTPTDIANLKKNHIFKIPIFVSTI
jgi:hypothetical protein